MSYKEYTVYGKCRNCEKEIILGYCGITTREILFSLVSNGNLFRIHKCCEGKLGIVEPIYFEEK